MSILFDCPCGRKLSVGDDHAGKQGSCPACGRILDIPNPIPPLEPSDHHAPESVRPIPPTPPVLKLPEAQEPVERPLTWPPEEQDRLPPRPPRRVVGKVIGALLFIAALIFLAIRLGQGFLGAGMGHRLAVTDTEELYYRDVSEEDAQRLGQALKDVGYFTGGGRKTVQISRQDNRYVLALVVKHGTWDMPDMADSMRLLGLQLSARVFNGEPVEVRLCDERMREKKSVKLDETLGKLLIFRAAVQGAEEIFYRGVTEAEARTLGNFLMQKQYFGGQGARTVLLTRDADGMKVTLVVAGGTWNNAEADQDFRMLGGQMRRELFGNAATEVRLADEQLRVKKRLPIP
jgi:hypothetical protein